LAEVKATSASLRIWSEGLDPAEITLALGVQPTTAHNMGEMFGPRKQVRARHGAWHLSADRQPGDCLGDQIMALLGSTSDDRQVWNDICANHKVDMFCGVWLDEPGEGLRLEPGVLAALAHRGIPLELDVYFGEPDQPVMK